MLDDYKLLYAEDDEQTRISMAETLSMMFQNVLIAKDGQEALELYKKESPNIIFLDIEMPFMNGLDVAAKIRQFNRNVPIVIITAYRDTEYFLKAVELNLTTYILKPIMIEDLQRAIKKCKEQLKYVIKKTIVINNEAYYNPSSRELYISGEHVSLTNMEMQFLEYMLKNPNRVIGYEEFESALWEDGMSSAAIRSLVRDLRHHLSKSVIENIPKVGYKFILMQ